MERTNHSRAARLAAVGRLVSCGLIALGLFAVALSYPASGWLRPEWFWSADDRATTQVEQARFDKLYVAFVTENQRRAKLGQPLLKAEPIALQRARDRLEAAKLPLRLAQQRPAQIATTLRVGGAIVCGVGLVGLTLVRCGERSTASPSSDAPAQ